MDVYIATKLFPGTDFLVVVQMRKDNPLHMAAFDAAKAYFLEKEMEIPDFNPPSSVVGETEYCHSLDSVDGESRPIRPIPGPNYLLGLTS